jgi:hypothetical protein
MTSEQDLDTLLAHLVTDAAPIGRIVAACQRGNIPVVP